MALTALLVLFLDHLGLTRREYRPSTPLNKPQDDMMCPSFFYRPCIHLYLSRWYTFPIEQSTISLEQEIFAVSRYKALHFIGTPQ